MGRHRGTQQHSHEASYPLLNDTTAPMSINNTNAHLTSTTNKRFASIKYVPRITYNTVKRFRQVLPDITIAQRPALQVNTIFSSLKKKLDPMMKSNVVYKIDCAECDSVYIGETTARLGDRIKQHLNDIKKMDTRESTALVGHAKRFGHHFKFDQASILKQEEIQAKLKIQEVNNIILHREHTCNYKTDSSHVTPTY